MKIVFAPSLFPGPSQISFSISFRTAFLTLFSCRFPERWFQLIVVLRCSNDVLYPRLQQRGYSDMKINENIEAEIFQVLSLVSNSPPLDCEFNDKIR